MPRLYSKKRSLDLTMLEIILAAFVVENVAFQRYMLAMAICDNFYLKF